MYSFDIQDFEKSIADIWASLKSKRSGIGSQDNVEDLTRKLGVLLGDCAYPQEGPNDCELDHTVLQEFQDAGLGAVPSNHFFPRLIIVNPDDPDDEIEVPIIKPT